MKSPTYSFTPTKVALVTAIFMSILLLVTGTLYGLNPNKPIVKEFATEYPANLSSLTAGCGNYFLFNEKTIDLVGAGKTNTILPVAGKKDSPTVDLTKKFYTTEDKTLPSRDEITSTMYQENATIIWYDTKANAEDIETAKTYAEEHPKLNIIVMPWTETVDGQITELPLNRNIGITSWGMSQSCATPNALTYDNYFTFLETNSWHNNEKSAKL